MALEILDQSTARKTRHNTQGERRAGRGQGEGGEKRQNKDRTETTGEAKEQGPKTRKEEDAPPHQSAQEDEKKERSRKGRAKVVTP